MLVGRRFWLLFLLPWLLLAACNLLPPTADPGDVGATEPDRSIVQGPATEETRSVLVTTTPDPQILSGASSPYEYTEIVESGPIVLDPALARDAASRTVVRNVMETLVYPHPHEPDGYIPLLATGWNIADDGLTVSFSIRRGVQFSNGNALTPDDVAYSLQRLLLASPTGGPQQVLLSPLLGVRASEVITGHTRIVTGTIDSAALLGGDANDLTDIAEMFDQDVIIGDRDSLVERVPAAALEEVCARLQEVIVPDDAEDTVTIHLSEPWNPLLSALSQTWTSVIDREWAVARGAWDGDCQTWQQWYALTAEASALGTAILGTGPYVLDSWAPGVVYSLRANEQYWRGDSPMWHGGPSGAPSIKTIQVLASSDANERYRLLERGEALAAQLSRPGRLLAVGQTGEVCDWRSGDCRETENSAGPLRRIDNVPLWQRQALFFNFDTAGGDIASGEDGYIGSGELDGEGVPPDFFADAHVRRAFANCFDDRGYVTAGLDDDGFQSPGLLPAFMGGPGPQIDPFPFRLQLCSEELAQAWDGVLPDIGFYLQLPFLAGDPTQQATAVLLQTNLRAVNPAYRLEVRALPAPLLQQALRERRLPLVFATWEPALPGAYHWVAPPFSSDMMTYQRLPMHIQVAARSLLGRVRSAEDPAARSQTLADLHQFYAGAVPFIQLPQAATVGFQHRRLEAWLIQVADPLPYYYAYALR